MAYGNGDSGSTKYAMRMICRSTLITSITIPSSIEWLSALKIGPGRRITSVCAMGSTRMEPRIVAMEISVRTLRESSVF